MSDLTEALIDWEDQSQPGLCATAKYLCCYFECGHGPTLVFIHGLNDRAVSFAPVIVRLADTFRCVAYELPTGESDGADIRRYRHTDLVADLLELVDHLGAGTAFLFGSSFGSTVALAALAAYPDRFPAAVLQGGFAHRPLRRGEALLTRFGSIFPGRMRNLPCRARMMRLIDSAAFANASPDVWEFFVANSGHAPSRAVARRARMLNAIDLRPFLPRIRQQVLMIGGDRDRLVPKACEMDVLQLLPNARRVELPGCGHYPQYTQPQRVADAVGQFLGSQPYQQE